MKRVLCIFFGAMVAAACGGRVDGGLPDAGGGGDGGPGPSPICPAQAPAENTSCGHEGAQCEYGTNTDYLCNTLAVCSGGRWLYEKGFADCSTGLAPGCAPDSSSVPRGEACDPLGTRCNYPDVVCQCAYPNGPATMSPLWECESPGPGCPIPRPRIGSACDVPADVTCDYGSCTVTDGVLLGCQDGAWVQQSVACAL
jgi:hypothetical protein